MLNSKFFRHAWRMAAVLCAAGLVAGAAAAEKKEKRSKAKHDPADQPFRRAPMAVAVRSVAIPLATNLHVAFDTELLRTHAAWSGESLNVWGAAYHEAKDRFYCDYDGPTLWSNPALFPWSVGAVPAKEIMTPPAGTKFRGISTKGGVVTLMYELPLGGGKTVRVHESHRRVEGGPATAIIRRLEIGACSQTLFFLAHAEMGKLAQGTQNALTPTIQREKNRLQASARADFGQLSWVPEGRQVDYETSVWTEKKNDSEIKKVRTKGLETRAWLKIPAHAGDIAVEIVSQVFTDKPADIQLAAIEPARLKYPEERRYEPAAEQSPVFAADKGFLLPGGDEFYRVEPFPLPKEFELQAPGMDFLPNGDLAVCTWQGDIYIVQQPQGAPSRATYRRYARGLCEPGGLRVINGQMYVVQKNELTRVSDTDGNAEADLFECVTQDWGFTGNYHDFSFGPALDAEGNFYVMRNGNRGVYEVPYMGWCLKISADGGKVEPFCSGLRSPNGFGTYQSDIFMAENQGNWIGAGKLNHMQKGRFYGFPSTKPAPREQFENPKEFAPPAVWFPYKLARSSSDMATVADDRFGPFKGQLLMAEFQNSIVTRVMLEKVNGEWQGAVWPMLKGFGSGVNRMAFGPDGKLYVGGCKNAAWAALGPRRHSLDRVTFTGKTPFTVKEAHALRDGFELTFTQPVDAAAAGNADSYDILQYRYHYHEKYGSPEYDHDDKENSATSIKVVKATVSADKLKVQLKLEGWKAGYVTMVRCLDVTNADGKKLWQDTFWYTLNQIPK
ncbi:MAG: PQQ-dependent sugar dehydrogenase [Verrucomicrobiota bacterium]